MRLESIRSGDIVLISKGGRRFHARVGQIKDGVIEVEPIERGISYRHASAREVLDHWRHRRTRSGLGEDDEAAPVAVAKGQLSLAGRLDTPR